jgi:hypothetical protein
MTWDDADVGRVLRESAAYRAVRALLTAADAAMAHSSLARALPRRVPLAQLGLILVIASLTHGVLVSGVPPSMAPAGRYLFAGLGLVAGAALAVVLPGRSATQ